VARVRGSGGRPEPFITVVIPTITGREHWLTKCSNSYHMTTGSIYIQKIILKDRPSCAVAWNEGIAEAKAPFIHLSADDLVAHPGWWQAAETATDYVPAPMILNTDGSLQSCGDADEVPDGTECEVARIPWASTELMRAIGPFPEDIHYYTDNWFSFRCRAFGYPSKVLQSYLFTHHLAPEGRERADAGLHHDKVLYDRHVRRAR